MPGEARRDDTCTQKSARYQSQRAVGEQEEDREILHAAVKSAGVLTAGACQAILARAPDQAGSWPLPRTERQVRARGDWLGTKLAGMARGGTQGA